MEGHKILAIAVASGRVGYVCLKDDQLLEWGITVKASKNTNEIVAYVQELIRAETPDVVVTEKCGKKCRKGKKSRKLINAITEIASHNELLDISVERVQHFRSKYEEADALVTRFPDLIGYLPERKRRIFEFEPRNMIIFEALSMAEQVRSGPPEALAAAMG
ncbi:hypothetical protein [uncultured Litoreibacter sp.]|uniref:hypothetical protein n=1 Tax=uncultured Litoreibacter sp. TaxID=1392394 RepID=UPI00263733F3|nr:hypothetical protein [uncultured Litoreibacter sp.]